MLAPDVVLQNRYRVVKQLGQGGMGAVYEAIDERLDTTVALKETLFSDERLRRQFEREARLLARMHHPALPRVSDHFSEADGQFLVMQYIAGDDLSQMMAQKRTAFPADQVLTWGDQLLDALDYLHTHDPPIVHRDIKPQNLKLTARGQIILLDFGLAKGQAGEVSRVTTTASIFGYTPNYAPLEQIQGLGTDPRSDIYALAATLYHLMTAVKPPDALSRAAALVNGQEDPLRPANEINGNIGPEVAAVLAKAMSQNREQRYASASEMRAALKGSAEVSTMAEKGEAATLLFNQGAPTVREKPGATLNTPTATPKTASPMTGETTVVRPARHSTGMRWGMGIAAIVLIGAIVGAFYAYQRRNAAAITVFPSPTPTPLQTPPTGNPVQGSNPVGSPTQTQNLQAAQSGTAEPKNSEKREQAAKSADKHQAQSELRKHRDEAPEPPDFPEPEIPDRYDRPLSTDPNLRRLGGGVTVRTLPDGTKIMKMPDGMRIVTRPDGTRHILRPGDKIPPRKPPAAN